MTGAVGGTATSVAGTLGAAGQGVGAVASSAMTGLVLSGLGAWVSGGATFVLHETADVLNQTTTPRLGSTWFSTTYWKVAGIAAVLTLPFLFAASVQALLRSDITLLVRAAFGYLPLAMLAVAIAAPVTMLLLSASDELAAAVSSAAGGQGANFLAQAVGSLGAVGGLSGSPFVVFLIGIFTVAGALTLWVELLMREAAVYVVVLMLPLAFAAFVWPARRTWAIRALEVLAALILSKFAIVAVLSLGAAALGPSAHGGLAGLLAGIVLLVLGAFTPWALLRLLPLAEVASSTAGALRGHAETALQSLPSPDLRGTEAERWMRATARMRHMAGDADRTSAQPRTQDALTSNSPASSGEALATPKSETSTTAEAATSTTTPISDARPSASTSTPISDTRPSASTSTPIDSAEPVESPTAHIGDVAEFPDPLPDSADEAGA